MDSTRNVSVWDTLPLSVSSASKCRNQHLLLQVKNQRKPEWFLTCSSADFPACNLHTIQIRRKCGRRRTHCAYCPFLNEYKQSKSQNVNTDKAAIRASFIRNPFNHYIIENQVKAGREGEARRYNSSNEIWFFVRKRLRRVSHSCSRVLSVEKIR